MTLQTVFTYILYFFFYSAAGWLGESIYCSIGERKIINRGFLVGPMCPIYGTGAMVMAVLLYNPFRDKPILVFLFGMILCDIVEYVTSYLMEKLFNARWWDYKDELLNIKGRICFKHTLYWGVGSLLFVRFVHPKIIGLFDKIPDNYIVPTVCGILVIFIIDVIYSGIRAAGVQKLKNKINELKTLVTENTQDAIDVIDSAYFIVKEGAENKYKTVVNNIESIYDNINQNIDKGNDKINTAREEIIIQAEFFISVFEEKVLRRTKLDKATLEFNKLMKKYKNIYKLNFKKPKEIIADIAKIIEDIKTSEND